MNSSKFLSWPLKVSIFFNFSLSSFISSFRTLNVSLYLFDVEYLTVRFSDNISKCVISDYFEIIYPEDKLTDSTEIIIRIDGQAPNVSSVEELLNIVPKKYITIDIDTSSDKDPVGCAWYKYNFRKQAEYLGNKFGFGFYVGGSSMDRVYS